MPEIADRLKVNYPENGWSSWFGGYRGIEYPSACPYGIIIRAPGSTGIFKPFNHKDGVKFPLEDVTSDAITTYTSTFQPPISVAPAFVGLSLKAPSSTRIFIQWYLELGTPPFIYALLFEGLWANMRTKIFLANPGPPPLPLLSKVGPVVIVEPWNRRGWELLP